jgi:type I restriction enzyme R subunit
MTGAFTESVVEDAALGWLEPLGYAVLHGPDIARVFIIRIYRYDT